MKTVIYQGNAKSCEVGNKVFQHGEKLVVSDAWIKKYGAALHDCRIYESLITDVIGVTVTYNSSGAPLDITAIIPQFKTPELIRAVVSSLRQFYPTLPLILVDDGSHDASTEAVRELAANDLNTEAVILEANGGHGPALHAGILAATTRWVFTLDSDCIVEHGGFLERMENRANETGLYAIGVLYYRDVSHGKRYYLSCVAALYDREIYLNLPPFIHSGDPMENNTRAAAARGYKVEGFPIFDYVWHKERGTRKAFYEAWDLTGLDRSQKRILIYGNTYITEVCVKALLKNGYVLVGYVQNSKEPTVPGKMILPKVEGDISHDIKLSIQFDGKIKIDARPAFNLHTGLLPEWGGTDILYHTIRQGATSQGMTFHAMTDLFDQGPIVSKISYPVVPGDDIVSLYRRMVQVAPRFIITCMEILADLGLDKVQQCPTYAPTLYRRGKIDPQDAELYARTPGELRELLGRTQ